MAVLESELRSQQREIERLRKELSDQGSTPRPASESGRWTRTAVMAPPTAREIATAVVAIITTVASFIASLWGHQ